MPSNSDGGTPVVQLGFTREELEAMEERAFPDAIESWIHGLVAAAIDGTVDYKHCWPLEPSGDASRGNPVRVYPVEVCGDGSRPEQCDSSSTGGRCDVCGVEKDRAGLTNIQGDGIDRQRGT